MELRGLAGDVYAFIGLGSGKIGRLEEVRQTTGVVIGVLRYLGKLGVPRLAFPLAF